MVERQPDYYDLYTFASTPDNPNILNFYLNNREVLEQFKFYFKEKAASIIAKAHKHTICVPNRYCPNEDKSTAKSVEHAHARGPLNTFEHKRYQVIFQNTQICFTQREIDVMYHLSRGCLTKEIAGHLLLSPKTIENYLNHIKDKLGLRRKSKLIAVISTLKLNALVSQATN